MKISKTKKIILFISFFIVGGIYIYHNYEFSISSSKFTSLFNKYARNRRRIVNICKPLQKHINNITFPYTDKLSITILNEKSEIIAEYNSRVPLVPASNIKIFTTAYSLDRLGPSHVFDTRLYKNSNGFYELVGVGDPDYSIKHHKEVVSAIKQNPFYTQKGINIVLYEESKDKWWPKSWSLYDRNYSYGSPISRLSFRSNSNYNSLIDPIRYFTFVLENTFKNSNLDNKINIKIEKRTPGEFKFFTKRKLLLSQKTAPLYMLLSLANSESHNFTSEVLLRNTSKSWSPEISSERLTKWLLRKGVDKREIDVWDGSGLSRKNLASSNSISKILYYMSKHKYKDYYISSFSVIGSRGTLKNQYNSENINFNFFGKSGTLSGVKSLSGYLFTSNGMKIISIISNNTIYNTAYFSDILQSTQFYSSCN